MKIASFWGGEQAVDEKCAKCGLHGKCQKPFTGTFGANELKTLIVFPKPSKAEDNGKTGFSGSTFGVVEDDFAEIGIDIRRSFLKCNALQCYISGKVDDKHIELCRPNLVETIKKFKPNHIITVGHVATKMAIGHMFSSRAGMPAMDTLTFEHIPIHEYGAWVHPILEPTRHNTANEHAYHDRCIRDVGRAIRKNKPLPKVDPFEDVEVLTSYDDIMEALEWVYSYCDLFAWDVEATGLKPHYKKHCITSIGIAAREKVFAFPVTHVESELTGWQGDDVIDLFVDILEDKRIGKIANPRKFDEKWAEIVFNCEVKGGLQDTQINQHLLDHRTGNKSLKYQAFVRWGIREYDKATEPYIASEVRGATQLNRMAEMPLREQLLYVGADAKLTLLLSDEQDKQHAAIDSDKKDYPRWLFTESSDVLKRIEKRGIPADIKYYKEKDIELDGKIEAAEAAIYNDPHVIEFENRTRKEFNSGSPIHLKKVLFDLKGYDPESVHKTDSGKPSTDEKALKDIGDPLCDAILERRKVHKLKTTYMAQFLREYCQGRIYTTYSLTVPRSYRSSSSDPNLQNIPKHDEYANKVCRTGMLPEKGMGLGEMDFSGMEVSVSASYHKDPNFIDYLITPGTDMHWDNTCDLWMLDPKIYTKKDNKGIRYHTKNCWTFPQFYGDYFGSCAPELWKQIITKNDMALHDGTPVREHILDRGIRNLDDFLEHTKAVEDKMWNERFKVYTAWKKEINDFYLANGYVETYMGFRFTGLMDRKQTTNYPIQGTAFHLLLWCMIHLDRWMISEKLRSYICGQIHDSIIFMWHPEEIEHIKKKMVEICTVAIKKEFEWINVPLGIDIELSRLREDGGNFAEIGEG